MERQLNRQKEQTVEQTIRINSEIDKKADVATLAHYFKFEAYET